MNIKPGTMNRKRLSDHDVADDLGTDGGERIVAWQGDDYSIVLESEIATACRWANGYTEWETGNG